MGRKLRQYPCSSAVHAITRPASDCQSRRQLACSLQVNISLREVQGYHHIIQGLVIRRDNHSVCLTVCNLAIGRGLSFAAQAFLSGTDQHGKLLQLTGGRV